MICISVAAPTVEEAKRILASGPEADLFEIRLDALREPAVAPFFSLSKPLIFTFRAQEEGGLRPAPLEERLFWLREAATHGASFVDLELACGPEAVAQLRSGLRETRLILSYHNFQKTPSKAYLCDKIKEMVELKADVGKVVCMVRRPEEGLELLSLIVWARRKFDLPLVAFGMGPAGRWTRAVSLFLGAPFTFAASRTGAETAPGQLVAEDLRKVLKILGV
ncbi:type I 3-dehydroquinate dehydratase [Thermosulfurimonas marina]|uniref:3-dehydroquinate dehydratase n=1 Tax=Thermosulfurimonas marina TaxID=2047767 RepID=A0A6H1WQ47_9BACT|nr:type I 3-dehydroquinate dehydratase [Thermosulfurimonas marina]QJA05322.1 type I 3-dehydroquinate dehydratase [Thermosulfurimonas marina]